jgi:His/Glu/Gln/Arg/opine family amino acid ABC transporter permease subunit
MLAMRLLVPLLALMLVLAAFFWPEAWLRELDIPKLLKAARYTLYLTALSMPLAVAFGLVLALMRLSRFKLISWPASLYVEVIRGTPLLVQLYIVYYSLPQVGQWLDAKFDADRFGDMLTLDNFIVGVICLAGNYAAYEAEIHRAGLQAIDKGQREAALSIGMSERQSFFHVVLPQAFRIVVPPIINDLIAMLKDSCLVSVIGVGELLFVAQGIGKSRFNMPQMLVAAAVIYLILSLVCYVFGKWVEGRMRVRGAAEIQIEKVRH